MVETIKTPAFQASIPADEGCWFSTHLELTTIFTKQQKLSKRIKRYPFLWRWPFKNRKSHPEAKKKILSSSPFNRTKILKAPSFCGSNSRKLSRPGQSSSNLSEISWQLKWQQSFWPFWSPGVTSLVVNKNKNRGQKFIEVSQNSKNHDPTEKYETFSQQQSSSKTHTPRHVQESLPHQPSPQPRGSALLVLRDRSLSRSGDEAARSWRRTSVNSSGSSKIRNGRLCIDPFCFSGRYITEKNKNKKIPMIFFAQKKTHNLPILYLLCRQKNWRFLLLKSSPKPKRRELSANLGHRKNWRHMPDVLAHA